MANEEHLAKLREGVEAWNAWREGNPGVRPDLKDADLRDANLSGANLSGANLSNTYLDAANLSKTNLNAADLSTADLLRADLRGANLQFANLSRALLAGADLTGANLGVCQLCDLDLRTAKGLDFARHTSPSNISTNTLAQSKGRIPEAFLRGCGLQDWEVKATRLYDPALSDGEATTIMSDALNTRLASRAFDFLSAFISYSHADKEFARKLHDTLQENGIRCWLDEHQMYPGDDIYDHIDKAIRSHDKVLLCCSETSLTSWWVEKEIDTAFAKERKLLKESGKKVLSLIPLDLDGYLFDGWEGGRTETVKTRLAAGFQGWKGDEAIFPAQMERLIKALRTAR